MYKCVRIFENGEKERKKQLERKSYGDQWAHQPGRSRDSFQVSTKCNVGLHQLLNSVGIGTGDPKVSQRESEVSPPGEPINLQ